MIVSDIPLPQVAILLKHLEGHRLALLYWMALVYGLRRGELLALTWARIDFKQKHFEILASLVEVKGKLHVVKPKTKNSIRTLPLTNWLIEQLCEYRTQQQALAARTPDWQENDLLFPSDVGTLMRPSNLNRHFRTIQQRLFPKDSKRFVIHELRHTHATLSAGRVDESQRPYILGHKAPGVTNEIYTQLRTDLQRIGLELVQQVLLDALAAAQHATSSPPSGSATMDTPGNGDE